MALATIGANADEQKFVFDGTNDMGGLTRQTDIKSPECVDGFSLSEDGVDFSITRAKDSGKGFALVNGGGTNAGIYIAGDITSVTDTKITLTVPNGKITEAKVLISGYAAITLEVMFNSKGQDSLGDGPIYYWTWKDNAGSETLTIEWEGSFGARYLHSIELTYTPDLGGKKACGLSFAEKDQEGILGKEFNAPSLTNPNGLNIEWSSSDENVATVDAEGNVTPTGIGQTFITAQTAGNDVYAAGNAKYSLTIIGCAENLSQMKEMAPNPYERVYVDFPMTVNYANGIFAYVSDSEGNPGLIENIKDKGSSSLTVTTIYKTGNIIPAGWIATNAFMYESVNWQGVPPSVTETVEVKYPEMTSVTREDADKVVVLKNVTFTSRTPENNTIGYGTTPDGSTYEFQNTFNTATKSAGTYDVTCVVSYSKVGAKEYFYLAPISFTVSDNSSAEIVKADQDKTRYYNMEGLEVGEPKEGIYIKIENGKKTKILK